MNEWDELGVRPETIGGEIIHVKRQLEMWTYSRSANRTWCLTLEHEVDDSMRDSGSVDPMLRENAEDFRRRWEEADRQIAALTERKERLVALDNSGWVA